MSQIIEQLELAKLASGQLRTASTKQKNLFLEKLAELLSKNKAQILKANAQDVEGATGLTEAMKKRLLLVEASVDNMAQGVRTVIDLDDPVGQVVSSHIESNGLKINRVRIPIGVIFFVFESRPNVIIDAAALAIKSGNALIVRGGKEACHSNEILEKLIQEALASSGLSKNCVMQLTDKSHEAIYEVVRQSEYIDLAVARGREQLISAVKERARVPVIAHERGVCHIYIDEFADVAKAIKIAVNAKVSNPAVCNSAEAILVHEKIADKILPDLINELIKNGVEVRGDTSARARSQNCVPAQDSDWGKEFLDLIVAVKTVRDIDEALAHIEKYGSRHSDAIVTENKNNAEKFLNQVNNAATLVNASTRLVDGGIFGLGAEFGISTASIHMRGPMGLADLTVTKYTVEGNGQIR
ncbi:MAG: glutamate-5-semialdehyde dehydrogenase [Candidatus Magasanikbacteria bacterium]|jgi:glutamate-5-semialdehyde dehydrogenase